MSFYKYIDSMISEDDRKDGDSLYFRYGFLLHSENEPLRSSSYDTILKDWQSISIGAYRILYHPSATVQTLRNHDRFALSIGDLICEQGRSVEQVLLDLTMFNDVPGLAASLHSVVGRYTVFAFSPGKTFAFNDPMGTQITCYNSTEQTVVGSHAPLVAAVSMKSMDFNVNIFTRSSRFKDLKIKHLPGIITNYKDVYSICPNNCLHIEERKQIRYWPNKRRACIEIDIASNSIINSLSSILSRIHSDGKSIVFGVTGGVDTRLMMAVAANLRIPIKGMTWIGDKLKNRDEFNITKKIYSHYEIEPLYVDVNKSSERMFGPFFEAVMLAVGPYRPVKGPRTFRENYDGNTHVAIRGDGGGVIKGFYQKYRYQNKRISSRHLVALYGLKKGNEFSRAAFEHYIREANYTEEMLDHGYDLWDIFYWEHRMGGWAAAVMSGNDIAIRTLAGFNSRSAFESALGVDIDLRLSKRLHLHATEQLDPEIARFPVY